MAERRGDWMQVFTGTAFWPVDPRPDEVALADIAHALSMLCRYGGHTRHFYSVAEHCVLLSHAVAPQHALWALLHDAAEAYLCDLPRPIKRLMPTYNDAETVVLAAICERFGLALGIPPEVTDADTRILLDERAALMAMPPPSPWGIEHLEPLGVDIQCWTPSEAEVIFGRRFMELWGDAVVPNVS